MKKNLITVLTSLLISLTLFSSCIGNDEPYGPAPYNSTIGELVMEDEDSYFIDSDKGNKFYLSNYGKLLSSGFKPGQRIYAEFAEEVDKEPFVGEVNVLYAYNVKVKDIVELTDENREEIGDDPINVYAMWTSKNFLNIQFQLFTDSMHPHFLNLVDTGSREVSEDGYVYLEFRHNMNGNRPANSYLGIISFDISEYLDAPGINGFVIKVKTAGYGERLFKMELGNEEGATSPTALQRNTNGNPPIQ